MASDTYYKDMWLRRNRTAVQVVIILLGVIALLLVLQVTRRSSPESVQSTRPDAPGQHGNPISDPGGRAPSIRGRVFGQDEDEFDPQVDYSTDDEPHDQATDCCTIYDLWLPNKEDIECSPLSNIDEELPASLVCFYPEGEADEAYNVLDVPTAKLILRYLILGGSTYGFIDVGAGIGAHSFLAAAIERSVLAVEPNINNVARFHKGTKLGRYERWITLLNNHASDSRDSITVVNDKPKVKQLYLDDLPAFCKFRKAIMKLDLGGHEHRVFQHAKSLFKEIQITYVFFHWAPLKRLEQEEDRTLMDDMITYFNKRGYVPRGYDGKVLSIKKWHQWPDHIYWHKM